MDHWGIFDPGCETDALAKLGLDVCNGVDHVIIQKSRIANPENQKWHQDFQQSNVCFVRQEIKPFSRREFL